MNREQYKLKQQILMRRLISKHTTPIFIALQGQMNGAAQQVRVIGIQKTLDSLHLPFDAALGEALTALYTDAAAKAKKSYVLSTKDAGFGNSGNFVQDVLDYFKTNLLNQVVVPISETTQKLIDRILAQALSGGWTVDKTVKQLEDTDLSKIRARLIVRTESTAATNFTQLKAADNENFEVEKEWIAIEDFRTRVSHSHAGVDGEVQDLDQPFSNGLMYPGDPAGDAAETCNCRCTMGYKMKRTLDGKLIPKKAA